MSHALRAAARYRLCSGFHLVPFEGSWLLYRPDGVFVRLHLPPTTLQALVSELGDETRATGDLADERLEVAEQLEPVLERFVAEGIARREPPPPEVPSIGPEGAIGSGGTDSSSGRSRVTVEGDGPIATLLLELLRSGGLQATAVAWAEGDGSVSSADLWVSCAQWLPDARFRELDAACVAHGVAWHGVYSEGCRFHLGPLWMPEDPLTARYADARDRRLAAAPYPEGLEAYWQYLDSGSGVPRSDPPSPAEAALVAGALAADILAWSAGSRPPSLGDQLAFDRATGRWRRHPVLPVPRGLLTEGIP